MYKKSERVVQKMNIKSGTIEQFGSFSQYQTLKEFKDNVGHGYEITRVNLQKVN